MALRNGMDPLSCRTSAVDAEILVFCGASAAYAGLPVKKSTITAVIEIVTKLTKVTNGLNIIFPPLKVQYCQWHYFAKKMLTSS
jgi:hypothetical protein